MTVLSLTGQPDTLVIKNGVECPKCKRTVSSFTPTQKPNVVIYPMCKQKFAEPIPRQDAQT